MEVEEFLNVLIEDCAMILGDWTSQMLLLKLFPDWTSRITIQFLFVLLGMKFVELPADSVLKVLGS
jgi:hypothetical protein